MKYAFIIEPQPIWKEANKNVDVFKIGIYDLQSEDDLYVDVPTHHVSGNLHEVKYLDNGKLAYKVDGAYFLDVAFVPTWNPIKTISYYAIFYW
jgi:hypothetical protein